MWWPEVTLVNEVHAREMENEELIIYADGTVEYEEKSHAQLEAHYNLRKFPFDRQVLEIEIESFAWTAACSNVPYGTVPEGTIKNLANNDSAGDGITFAVPPNPDGPTLVSLGLYIVVITAISEIDNTFQIEGFLDLVWCDPRLAFDGNQGSHHPCMRNPSQKPRGAE